MPGGRPDWPVPKEKPDCPDCPIPRWLGCPVPGWLGCPISEWPNCTIPEEPNCTIPEEPCCIPQVLGMCCDVSCFECGELGTGFEKSFRRRFAFGDVCRAWARAVARGVGEEVNTCSTGATGSDVEGRGRFRDVFFASLDFDLFSWTYARTVPSTRQPVESIDTALNQDWVVSVLLNYSISIGLQEKQGRDKPFDQRSIRISGTTSVSASMSSRKCKPATRPSNAEGLKVRKSNSEPSDGTAMGQLEIRRWCVVASVKKVAYGNFDISGRNRSNKCTCQHTQADKRQWWNETYLVWAPTMPI